ncbi:biotin--[acetyl-CoA-carboxylase] ligase [Paenibacillus polymyxa]|uniref:biotin--[acetyl-CoA-carboxylase] ligase n=1 Tax=Paenibacillus polymyxa TaxID=1406 RepID=UPI0007EBCE3E|nr:biotin--[acetyl-CoA-carboxylase] ligase [Paenibacillus polymyxa]OAZ48612.1 biotin--[acetyl-CoA-carboxylase] ligase [Paenibacillus polymyxa]
MNNHERLLGILEEGSSDYVSGEEISRRLSVSRTAVWKQINKLRELGYNIDASSRRGYRLISQPDRLEASKLADMLNTQSFGQRIVVLDSTVSTQQDAMRLAEEGAPEGTLVLAEEQTAGRGRLGRKWYSPRGKGIWMSIVLRPTQPLAFTPQLTLLTGVAVCRAIRRLTGVEAGIKWPNDLLIHGRKVSGILLESATEDQRVRYCIAGIGIDVNLNVEDYPEELSHVGTSLKIEAGLEVDRTALIAAVLEEMELLSKLYAEQGFQPIAMLWEALSVTMNRSVRAHTGQGIAVEGTAVGLDPSGALVIETNQGERIQVISGDIQL